MNSFRPCAIAIAVVLAASLSSCRKAPPPGMAEEASAIRTSVLDWASAIKAGEIEKVVEFYTTDVAMLPAGLLPCQGHAMIRKFWADWRSRSTISERFSVRFDAVDIAASQDFAWSSLTFYHGPSGDLPAFGEEVTWVIMHKKVNGKWYAYFTISYAHIPPDEKPQEPVGDFKPEYSAGMVVPHGFTLSVVGQYIELCGKRFALTGKEPLIHDELRGAIRLMATDNQSRLEIFKEYVVLRMPASRSNGDSIFVFRKRDLKSLDLREGISDTLAYASLNEDQIFVDLSGQYILLDYGTGPDWRSFEVFDMDTRKVICGEEYIDGVLFWGDHEVRYTTAAQYDSSDPGFASIKAELKAKEAELKDTGISTIVLEDCLLDLRTLTKTRTGDIKVGTMQ